MWLREEKTENNQQFDVSRLPPVAVSGNQMMGFPIKTWPFHGG